MCLSNIPHSMTTFMTGFHNTAFRSMILVNLTELQQANQRLAGMQWRVWITPQTVFFLVSTWPVLEIISICFIPPKNDGNPKCISVVFQRHETPLAMPWLAKFNGQWPTYMYIVPQPKSRNLLGTGSLKCSLNHRMREPIEWKFWALYLIPSGLTVTYS